MNLKVEMIFTDRIGIVADISARIAAQGLNIASMEVVRRNRMACVYFEIQDSPNMLHKQQVTRILEKISNLREIRFIGTLPQEERENRVRVVLDNIRSGVISIDKEGKITTINRVAREALGCGNRDIIGDDIRTLNLPDYKILDCLKGSKYQNVKKNLISEKGRRHYFSTGRPIRDASGLIIGAVLIARDMQEIKNLARSISDPDQIGFSDIIGNTAVIKEAISFARKIAPTDAVVTLRGESGTGKELFARAIHTESGRKGPFVPINCAALPDQLLESELFGYSRGAFTGSRKEGKPGLFEEAQDGTVFLDEIGEMPMGAQAKILRLIQEKRVRRIGDSKEIPVNARIISATNRNLEQDVERKNFRRDLYYRISVLPIHIPPLRQRKEDVSLLADHFLFQRFSKLGRRNQAFSPGAVNRLLRHDWPGNVRELKNTVDRALILCDEEVIDAEYIFFSDDIGSRGIKDALPREMNNSLKDLVKEYEKTIIDRSLKRYKTIRQAAKNLGISHTALRNKLKKFEK